MMREHLSAVGQLGDYATAAQRFLVGVETVCDWTELNLLNGERHWERLQEGDALASVAVAAAAALNDVAAVTQAGLAHAAANSRGCVCLYFYCGGTSATVMRLL